MLATSDIADLFHSMRIAYGGQWKHGADAVETWRRALSRFDAPDVHRAANGAIERYVNHPPTLPQFLELLRPAQRPNTYLPAPQIEPRRAGANRVLLLVLMLVEGVDRRTLANLVALKNALLEEPDMTAREMERQLTELAENHDREAKARETEEEREKFCRRQGIAFVPRRQAATYGRSC